MSVTVPANRSPIRSTRSSTSSDRNRIGSSPSAQAATSSHVTGVDTVRSGRARGEYTPMVVLCRLFWLKSMNTLPGRYARLITLVTRSGWRRSSSCATAWAKSRVWSWACGQLSGT